MSKFSSREIEYVEKALKNHASSVSFVDEFEERFANRFGSKYAIAVNSGTSGLHTALWAAGVKPGDEVLVPALTVVMDAYICLYLGAKPVFVEVDRDTHVMCVEDMRRKYTNKTKAILTVAWEGVSCDMDAIIKFAKEKNIFVVDDCARAVLSTYKGKTVGTIADISVFSFESKKHLTTGGEGGLILTDNSELAKRARQFAGLGYKHLQASGGTTHLASEIFQRPDYERFGEIGYNYRMNNISAAVGLGQLDRIEEIVDLRKRCGKLFEEASAGYSWFTPQKVPNNYTSSYYTFSVSFNFNNEIDLGWIDFYERFKKNGGDGFYGCVQVPYLEPVLKTKYTSLLGIFKRCENTEKLQKTLMCFKTNYRDLSAAHKQADILEKTLQSIA